VLHFGHSISASGIRPHCQQRHVVILHGPCLELLNALKDEIAQILDALPAGSADCLAQALHAKELARR
jgi:hypothetical protein